MQLPNDPDLLFPDGTRQPFSRVMATRASRAAFLAAWKGRRPFIRCGCTVPGVPVGVARRTVPTKTYYLYPLHPGDAQKHRKECPMYVDPEASRREPEGDMLSGALPLPEIEPVPKTPPLVERQGSRIRIRFADGLMGHTGENERQGGPRRTGESDLSGSRPAASLRTLLEVLMVEAGLHEWDPRFAGKRHYGLVRHRLVNAVDTVDLGDGAPLANALYMPPRWNPAKREEVQAEWRAFVEKLTPREDSAPRGLVAGLVREIDTGRLGDISLKLSSLYQSLWVPPSIWDRAVPDALAEVTGKVEGLWLVLALVDKPGKKDWLRVINIAVIQLSPEYIPLGGEGQERLVQVLVDAGRTFERRFKWMEEEDKPEPSILLTDTRSPVAMEVEGGKNPDKVHRRMDLYAKDHRHVWLWFPDLSRDMPPLPEKATEGVKS